MTHDSRFDEAEAEVDRGTAWKPKEAGMPNPLTIIATDWSSGVTKLGDAEWLNGTDRDGKRWSILVGSAILQKRLLEGVLEEWSDETQSFVEVGREGKVRTGEVVSIKYEGDVQGAKYVYPKYSVVRKPVLKVVEDATQEDAAPAPSAIDTDIPF